MDTGAEPQWQLDPKHTERKKHRLGAASQPDSSLHANALACEVWPVYGPTHLISLFGFQWESFSLFSSTSHRRKRE